MSIKKDKKPNFNARSINTYKKRNKIPFLYDAFLFALWAFVFFFSACERKETATNEVFIFDKTFNRIDSVQKSGNINYALKILDSVRPNISNDDIQNLSNFYIFSSQIRFSDKRLAYRYADSLLALLNEKKEQEKYKKIYTKALILKSDAYVFYKQYDDALRTYFKTSSLIDKEKDPINYSDFASKIAHIYYVQGRFALAAHYQKEAYTYIQRAKDVYPQTRFYLTQGALNNAGFSYERAGILDSALIFYNKNIQYIQSEEGKATISEHQINAAKIVAFDNLGGLFAKKGNDQLAQKYLEQSIAMNDYAIDPSKISAFIKLAKVYAHTNKIEKADSILNATSNMLTLDTANLFSNQLKLYRAKSDIYFRQKRYKEGYENLNAYLSISDSLNLLNNTINKIDLAEKFRNLESQDEVKSLTKTNQSKTIYLVGAILFLVMLIPLIMLTLKNTKQARKAERDTVKHNRELKKTLKRLESRNRDYAKMMKVMAHDLKNPIGGMVGIANLLLQEDKFSAEDREMLQLIESSGENSIEMINQLLNSGLAIENEVIKKEKTDIQHLLRQCTELLQYKADEKKQKIIFYSGGPVKIMLGKEKIWRVFNNLIVNAIKFSAKKTTIKVVLERLQKSVRIAIVDQGIGVPEADKHKIFEMFTDAKRPGTSGEQPFGIGLSISKQIIESHQGKIWLEDNPEGGTIFYVELPI